MQRLAFRTVLHPVVASLETLLLLWFAAALITPPEVVPSPLSVGKEVRAIFIEGDFPAHVGITLLRMTAGWAFAMMIGIVVGIAMGSRTYWNAVLRDPVIVSLSLPGILGALVGVIWFGASLTASIVAVGLIAFALVAVNIYEGVRSLEKNILDMAKVYQTPWLRLMRKVVVPSMLPFILAAARQCFAYAWKVISLVEVFGATSGIGYQIRSAYDQFSIAGIIAWTLMFTVVLMSLEYGIFRPLERHLLRWRPRIGTI